MAGGVNQLKRWLANEERNSKVIARKLDTTFCQGDKYLPENEWIIPHVASAAPNKETS